MQEKGIMSETDWMRNKQVNAEETGMELFSLAGTMINEVLWH